MSWKVQALVSERVCGGMSRKMILINMAARANDDGTGVYASLPTMAAWCEVDARTIRRVVRSIEQDGLARVVKQRECKNGYVNEWELDLERIAALPLVKDEIEERRKINAEQKRTPDIKSARTLSPPGHDAPPDIKSGRTQSPVTPDIMSAKSILEPKPSSSKKERVRRPKPAKHAIPADWEPNQALIDFASEHGYSEHEARFIGHKVVTHFTASGEHRPGWDATYRNWVTRETPRQVKAAAAQWRAPSFDRERALRIHREHGFWDPRLGPEPQPDLLSQGGKR
jgi:hypothetical protein